MCICVFDEPFPGERKLPLWKVESKNQLLRPHVIFPTPLPKNHSNKLPSERKSSKDMLLNCHDEKVFPF